MYKRYEPSEQVFVDREEYLEWMDEALKRCKEQSVVLHIRGIGGIGKSSLLAYWTRTIDSTIRLDCQQYPEFYARLNVLAKGAILLGIQLPRFDVLWQIRQRFVEGVEPVREEGREWAKEVVTLIPFIGSLASIGSAIKAVGAKVTPKLKGRYSSLGKWLQEVLGKNHVERLLEILWKEPRHAEFLFLDALLEDLNGRKSAERPLIFLFDHFEYVDAEAAHWRYSGKQITEAQLWCVFLSSLSNCVGVMASRKSVVETQDITIENSELTELERESCIELLDLRGVKDSELRNRIVSVSGGNPFVIGAICDLADAGGLSLEKVEDLRADTLEAVRLKTWRRLFDQATDLLSIVEKAGLVPFFNRRIMIIIAPEMRTDQWDRLVHLSFVKDRGNGTWVLHDLARDLIIAELNQRLQTSTNEIATLLEESSNQESDYTLLGLAISAQAVASEREAEARLSSIVTDLAWNYEFSNALALLNAVTINTKVGRAIIQGLKGCILTFLNRYADGEHELLSALEVFEENEEDAPDELAIHKAQALRDYGILLHKTQRTSDGIDIIQRSASLYGKLDEKTQGFRFDNMGRAYWWLGMALTGTHRPGEGEQAHRKAYELAKKSKPTASYVPARFIMTSLRGIGLAQALAGKTKEAEATLSENLAISRELAKKRPEIRFTVAMYATDLGDLLRLMSRPSEAIGLLQEAVDVTREYVEKEHGSHSQSLVLSLNNLAKPLWQTGRYEEASEKYQEALALSRNLAEKNPDAFLPYVAWTLLDYAVLLRVTGRTSEAEEACGEALRLHKKLSAESPDRYLRILAWNLNNLAVILREIGRITQAEESYREALDRAREIAKKAPECVYVADLLATIISNSAVLLRQIGKTQEARGTIQEALALRRQLAEKAPELFLHRVATTLNNLGIVLFETGKPSEAEEAFREALKIRRELLEKSPEQYKAQVVSTLSNLGILLRQIGRTEEARDAYCEAIDLGERLLAQAPMVYQHDLAKILCNYALVISDLGIMDTSQKVMAKLKEMGVEKLPKSEEWSEEEEAEANPAGVT
ncbi:MAG: tetratricopeptide repeat protein [Candidatus Thorarchaeota archaeon]|nr:tetratricopeptide repeat protein [Candidatus Thorarchaeota archaeon]